MTCGDEPVSKPSLCSRGGVTLHGGEQHFQSRSGTRDGRFSHTTLGSRKSRGQRPRREEALTDVLEDVDDEERRDQVVDALHVAAGWVSDGPDEQDPLENLTGQSKRREEKTYKQTTVVCSSHSRLVMLKAKRPARSRDVKY